MVVHGLQNGLAHGQELEVLLHDLHIITSGTERGERLALALLAVETVVVVDADGADGVGPDGRQQAPRQGRLAGRAVPGNSDYHRPVGTRRAGSAHHDPLVGHVASPLVSNDGATAALD
jgi:hypothetical protein